MTDDFNEDDVRFTYRFLGHRHETEIRLIDPEKKLPPRTGFVHSEEEFVRFCKDNNGGSYNIYAGINERRIDGTQGKDVISVNAMCFDFDPIRDKTLPSSDTELDLARKKALEAASFLRQKGLIPILGESGNGVQAWVKIECPVNDANRTIVENNLKAWQKQIIGKFQDGQVAVDTLGDLPRIIKVIGTKSVKGAPTVDRPHRVSHWIERPKTVPSADKIWSTNLLLQQTQEREESKEDGEQEDLSIDKIINGCAWMRHCKKDSRTLTEREWLGLLGVSARCADGREKSQLLSQDYPNYTPEETAQKIDHALKAGPQTCDYVRKNFPKESPGKFCLGCAQSVTSPIQLGRDRRRKLKLTQHNAVAGIISQGLFNPKADISRYDQLKTGIEFAIDDGDEKLLWTLSQACRLIEGVGLLGLARWAATEAVLLHYHIATQETVKPEIFWYDEKTGMYKRPAEPRIRTLVRRFHSDCSDNFVSEIIAGVRDRTYRDIGEFESPSHLLCLANGILNLRTSELTLHTHEIIFLSSIPVIYDPQAKCDLFEKFLKEVVSKEDGLVIQEFLGYLLLNALPYHVALFLLGDGRNGKTTLLNVIRAFIGKENFSSRSLHDLASQHFALYDIYGKKLNVSGEVAYVPLKDTGMFKNLCGGEAVNFEGKFLKSFTTTWMGKMIFACNRLPMTEDVTLAM